MAATISLIQMLAAGVVDSAGLPIASGRARFYQPGTLTPVTVYADSAAAGAVTPPLILTAGGTGIAYTQQPTRMIVKDATDTNTLFDGNVNTTRAESDYVTSTAFNGGVETRLQTILDSVATSLGGSAGFWTYKQASNGTERNLTSVIGDLGVSVKSFGAVGNGVADDTAAMQATITYVASLGGGTVYVPNGTYLISSALSITTKGLDIVGAGASSSTIRQTNATANGISVAIPSGTSVISNRIAALTIDHATTSTGAALVQSVVSSVHVYGCRLSNNTFRTGFKSTAGAALTVVSGSYINANSADANSVGIDCGSNGGQFIFTASFISGALNGAQLSVGTFLVTGCVLSGSGATGNGLSATATVGALEVSGCSLTGGASGHGVSIGAGFSGDLHVSPDQLISPDMADARTASTSPVCYTFAVNGSFKPLPSQSQQIRVIATAAVTVTINATDATGFGFPWRLYCINSSGGAVTWTFNAQYKTSAAVAPATGNMIIVTFEYDPVSAVVREVGRSGTIPI